MLSLKKCQWITNSGGGPTAWIPASETLALQHSSSPIPDVHPASRRCPASKGETGVSSGHLTREFCEALLHLDVSFPHQRAPWYLGLFIADLHLSRWFSSALPQSCLLLCGSDPQCCSRPLPPQRHKGKAELPALSPSGGTSVRTHPQSPASAAVSWIK